MGSLHDLSSLFPCLSFPFIISPSLPCVPFSFQADNGAQVIQIFDSWASELQPQDFDVFSGPYIKRIISAFKCAVAGVLGLV